LNIQRLLIPVALLVVAAMVVLATSLWVRHQGRDFRLTDVGGNVVEKVLA